MSLMTPRARLRLMMSMALGSLASDFDSDQAASHRVSLCEWRKASAPEALV